MKILKEMQSEGYKKIKVRYYFVDGKIDHQTWGKNKKDVYNRFPELKGKNLVYNRQETKWVK